jgi:hypothetical protein
MGPVDLDIAATPAETVTDLLTRSKHRTSTPLRRSFLKDTGPDGGAGPLATFVRERRSRPLDLLILAHAVSSEEPWHVDEHAMTWGRCLYMRQNRATEAAVSRMWTWLEGQRLVRTERHERKRRVILLREDGSGAEFTLAANGEGRGYFRLPHAYFFDEWHVELSLPAKAMLLIACAQKPRFELPIRKAAEWYHLTPSTVQRGFDELRDAGIFQVTSEWRKAPRARYGVTQVNVYRLLGAFKRAEAPKKRPHVAAKGKGTKKRRSRKAPR